MGILRLISGVALALCSLTATADTPAPDLLVTRHFTGLWDQVDQESQGIALHVIEQKDDSRVAVAYWYTYGDDRRTAWFLGVGDITEDHIDFELYDSTDVGFMQDGKPGDDSVHTIGTMTITFDNCESGMVEFETSHDEVGSGFFRIERLTEIMNTHCSGGISDDMHADAMFGEQRIQLQPARDGISGSGHARYEDYPGHSEFEMEVEGLGDGAYHLFVGSRGRGEFAVHEGRGEMEFASPGETGKVMLTFDPREMMIEVHDAQGAVLSSFEDMFEHGERGRYGDEHGEDDHGFDCEGGHGPGHGMGRGMDDCVNDGEFIEIETDLENTGVFPEASGEAEWDMNAHRVEFSVEIEDVPAGAYTLNVGGHDVGVIQAVEMSGEVAGEIEFRDPEVFGKEYLDFEPRGEQIRVLLDGDAILEVEFPAE